MVVVKQMQKSGRWESRLFAGLWNTVWVKFFQLNEETDSEPSNLQDYLIKDNDEPVMVIEVKAQESR